MLLHDAASAYPTEIPTLNEYLLESHAQLFQSIMGLLQGHSMYPVSLTYLSTDPSSFLTSLPS